MGFRETLRLISENPKYIEVAIRRRKVEAMRDALATFMPAGIDVSQVVFSDHAEPAFAPVDQAGICRRLYHNRLALNFLPESSRGQNGDSWLQPL